MTADRGAASVDESFVQQVSRWTDRNDSTTGALAGELPEETLRQDMIEYFDAQVQSRHLDFAAREMQKRGYGFYTIGSAGHESNAAVARALRPTDPALLHYRSGGFYAARAAQVPGSTPIRDVLLGMAAAADDPISGGRHKVFGNVGLNIIPQTSTIASHLPRAVGIGFSLARAKSMNVPSSWPEDSIVVCSFGDASANHSTAVGALNSAGYCSHRGISMPMLFVCEDNGIGISTKTPGGWLEAVLSSYPGIDYEYVDGADPEETLVATKRVADSVRGSRRPAILHLRTVRFMGHAGSDAELGYRTPAQIHGDYERDPLLHTARWLFDRHVLTAEQILERYERVRKSVMDVAAEMEDVKRLATPEDVVAPLAGSRSNASSPSSPHRARSRVFGDRLPEDSGPLTLAQTINAALADAMVRLPESILFGEDVSVKGGVYGLTRGLRKKFGGLRVFDTILDEQTILGTALGSAVTGLLPIPEIQYLAYLHNAEDQLRGEAATLRFFSNEQYQNGMVVRVAGLSYQKGFGGHFHNDNSVAVLRDIPGVVLAVPSHPRDATGMLNTCLRLAKDEGRVCIFLEPIALYHVRDLHFDGDEGWLAPYSAPAETVGLNEVKTYGTGGDLLIITFGNGLPMSLRAARELDEQAIRCTVLDVRWLSPLPEAAIFELAQRFEHVLIADETRRSGGVSESIIATLVDRGFGGSVKRVTSIDSFVPLGPAADHVLLNETQVVQAGRSMVPQ